MQRKILAVDDEPDIIDIYVSVVESLGYQVLIARDGQEAVKLAEQHQSSADVLMKSLLRGRRG